jgi:hypothetical protein
LVAKEKSIEKRLNEPSVVQQFIENEARKKDEARRFRIEAPTEFELMNELKEIVQKLIGMVVTFERRGYCHGRIIRVNKTFFDVELRGTKEKVLVDFNEILRLSNNYA